MSRARLASALSVPALVFLAAALPFYPALSAEFVNFDDGKLYLQNEGFRGFSLDHLRWMFTTTYMGHYQPLTWLSAAFDYQISGTSPSSYHRTNVLLHALNAVLVYFVAARLIRWGTAGPLPHGRGSVSAAIAALLFAVHPLRVESVAWVSERRDVLSTFFLLGSLLAYLRAIRREGPGLRSLAWYVAACAFLVLSLLSKAWGMTFFVVLALLNVYPLRRLPPRPSHWFQPPSLPILGELAPLALLGIFAAIMAATAQSEAHETMKTLAQWGPVERLVQAFYGLAFYVWKSLWPSRLAVLYELPRTLNLLELRYVSSFLSVIVASALAYRLRHRIPALPIAAIIYAVLLAPVLGLAQSGPQFVAERYSYVSCMSWAILAGGGVYSLLAKLRSRALTSVAAIASLGVCGLCASLTWKQSQVWKNSRTLWAHAIDVGIPSARAHLDVGTALLEENRPAEALPHFREAVSRNPEHGSAWYYLGQSLSKTGSFGPAAEAFERAASLMVNVRHTAYLELAELYKDHLGRPDDAIAAYRSGIEAMKSAPPKTATPRLYIGLGEVLKSRDDIAGAKAQFVQAAKYRSTRDRAIKHLRELGVEIRERPSDDAAEK